MQSDSARVPPCTSIPVSAGCSRGDWGGATGIVTGAKPLRHSRHGLRSNDGNTENGPVWRSNKAWEQNEGRVQWVCKSAVKAEAGQHST